MYDYALENNLVIVNEKNEIITLALQQYKKPKNTAYLGACINFYLGLRVGELVALHTDDFSKNQVYIHSQEVKAYKVVDGRTKRQNRSL